MLDEKMILYINLVWKQIMFKGFVLRQCDIVVLEERLSTGNRFFNSKYDNIGLIFCFKIGVTKIKIIMGFRYWTLDDTVILKKRDISCTSYDWKQWEWAQTETSILKDLKRQAIFAETQEFN